MDTSDSLACQKVSEEHSRSGRNTYHGYKFLVVSSGYLLYHQSSLIPHHLSFLLLP